MCNQINVIKLNFSQGNRNKCITPVVFPKRLKIDIIQSVCHLFALTIFAAFPAHLLRYFPSFTYSNTIDQPLQKGTFKNTPTILLYTPLFALSKHLIWRTIKFVLISI